jgi:hypothetical protein
VIRGGASHFRLTCVLVLQQPTTAGPRKRPLPSAPEVEPEPQPLPTRALPEAVWEDYMLPLLTARDAARLGCTCKALRGVVREHFNHDLGRICLSELKYALTTFPRARTVALYCPDHGPIDRSRCLPRETVIENGVNQLCEGGHGGDLTTIRTGRYSNTRDATDTIYRARERGAFPSLRAVSAVLEEIDTSYLKPGGILAAVHDLRLRCNSGSKGDLLKLGLVGGLPSLAHLEVDMSGKAEDPVRWPPFIPPSLKALRIILNDGGPPVESLLRALPALLGASGARLDRLEVHLDETFSYGGFGEQLVHLAQALRYCSPTLEAFHLLCGDPADPVPIDVMDEGPDHDEQEVRLRGGRTCWRPFPAAAISACWRSRRC